MLKYLDDVQSQVLANFGHGQGHAERSHTYIMCEYFLSALYLLNRLGKSWSINNNHFEFIYIHCYNVAVDKNIHCVLNGHSVSIASNVIYCPALAELLFYISHNIFLTSIRTKLVLNLFTMEYFWYCETSHFKIHLILKFEASIFRIYKFKEFAF